MPPKCKARPTGRSRLSVASCAYATKMGRSLVGAVPARSRPVLLCSGRGPGYPGPPAQIPACGFPAPGSCRRSNAIKVRGFGGPCAPDPQARSVGYTPHPALSPGRALLLAFPPAGRLPSTISATDSWSALFEASQVLCSRPTPHLSRDGFASSASRRGPAPAKRFGRDEVSQVPARSLHT
jgi:hypothetical protein